MNRLQQIRARQAEIRANLEVLAAIDGNLDDAQRSDWEGLNTEYDSLETEAVALEERNARMADLRSRTLVVETGDGAAGAGAHRAGGVQVQRSRPDNLYDLEELRNVRGAEYGRAVRDRAMWAIEDWDRSVPAEHRERAAALVANPRARLDREVAEHILRYGSPEYFSAWCRVLANPQTGLSLLDADEARAMRAAMNEATLADGGYMVPPFLDPTVILQNVGISNPFREIATVKATTFAVWKGVTSAGVTAEWTAEAAEAADASPTVGSPAITPHRADAYVQASFEMIEDTSIAMDLATLFGDARDRLEGAAFATGAGDSSNQPQGVVTGVAAVTSSRVAATTAYTFGAPDVFDVDNAMSQRYRPGAHWVANKSIYNLARQFAIGSGGMTGSFWVDFGGGHPSSLIGYPVHEASAMAGALATTGTAHNVLILGNFSQGYYIVDRIGMSVAYNPLVIGTNRRPTGEVGWFAFWRTGGAVINADAFRLLQV
jgi:HK97 family phage major capsid protein